MDQIIFNNNLLLSEIKEFISLKDKIINEHELTINNLKKELETLKEFIKNKEIIIGMRDSAIFLLEQKIIGLENNIKDKDIMIYNLNETMKHMVI